MMMKVVRDLKRQSWMAYSWLKPNIEMVNNEDFDVDDSNQDHQDKYLIANDQYLKMSLIKLTEKQNDLKHRYQHR